MGEEGMVEQTVPEISIDSSEIKTNIGRKIASNDLLFYSERRGPEKFAQLLSQGVIKSPALAVESGEKFVDEYGQKRTVASTETEPNVIFMSLRGPYWSSGSVLVFNAWDTLSDFRFNDSGNTGVRLYDNETDGNPANVEFVANHKSEEFLIIVPNLEEEDKIRRSLINSAKLNMTEDEIDKWLDDRIVTPESIIGISEDWWRQELEQNRGLQRRLKKNAERMASRQKEPSIKARLQELSYSPEVTDDMVALANGTLESRNWTLSKGNVVSMLNSPESTDMAGSEYIIKTTGNEIDQANLKLASHLQIWLKDEFDRRFGDKKDRKATVTSSGEGHSTRIKLKVVG